MSYLDPDRAPAADPLRRWAAHMIDTAAIFVLVMVMVAVAIVGSEVLSAVGLDLDWLLEIVLLLLLLGGQVIYGTLLESGPWGATLGKKLLGLAVVAPSGHRITWEEALGRNLLKLGVMWFVSFLSISILFDRRRRRAPWDIIGPTMVIRGAPRTSGARSSSSRRGRPGTVLDLS